jgi:hypothetical protein
MATTTKDLQVDDRIRICDPSANGYGSIGTVLKLFNAKLAMVRWDEHGTECIDLSFGPVELLSRTAE